MMSKESPLPLSLTSYLDRSRDSPSTPPTYPKVIPCEKIESILMHLLESKELVQSLLLESQAISYRKMTRHPDQCSNLPIQTIGQVPNPEVLAGKSAQMCIKTAYVANDTVIVSKMAAGGGDDPIHVSPNTGTVSIYDQRSLRLTHLLCDEGLLTEVRTAAAGAYVTRGAVLRAAAAAAAATSGASIHYNVVRKVGLVGGGVQAIWQLRLLIASDTVDPSNIMVVVKTRSEESARQFIQTMAQSAYPPDRLFQFEIYNETHRFTQCQIIYTLTPSRSIVLKADDVMLPSSLLSSSTSSSVESSQPFLHITAIGSDSPGKCEIDTNLLDKADICLVDLESQSKERGEFQSYRWENSHSKPPKLLEVGQNNVMDENNGILLAHGEKHQQQQQQHSEWEGCTQKGLFTIFDSSGLPMQDLQFAKIIMSQI